MCDFYVYYTCNSYTCNTCFIHVTYVYSKNVFRVTNQRPLIKIDKGLEIDVLPVLLSIIIPLCCVALILLWE